MRISILLLGACSAMSLEGMHGLTAEDVNKCQDLDCLSTIVQEGKFKGPTHDLITTFLPTVALQLLRSDIMLVVAQSSYSRCKKG